MRLPGIVAAVLLMAVAVSAQTASPGAGVPLDLAARRAGLISDLRYELALSLPDAVASPIIGSVVLRFQLADASQPLVIDFDVSPNHVQTVEANAQPVNHNYVNGHIVVPAASLKAGLNTVRVSFTAGETSLNRHSDFLYTLFVPARARLAIPCFDQPDLKGRWTVSLEHPASWQSAANGAELKRTTVGTRSAVQFAETPPLPTYLVAFAAGDFKIETAVRGKRTFRMFHRETDAGKVARNRDVIFDLHARALEFLEAYTTIPYPFDKFDFVLIPAFQFGGMEHAGKILYNASGLLLDESATQNQLLGRASVISHETAHMWFGDLVTMKWFDDVWMKEVFANFMAAKIVNPSFPAVNHDLRFLLAHYPAAYDVDRTLGANPIRQPLENLNEAGSLYGPIIYQKAPVIMRHLEAMLGEESFRDGLREYLKMFAFKNATWNNLIGILDARTPADLAGWSRVWVEQPGRPTIQTELDVRNGRISRLAFRQRDPRGRNLIWPQQLRVIVGSKFDRRPLMVDLNGAQAEVPMAFGLPAPLYVLPNASGWAYAEVILDKASLDYLTTSLPEINDVLTRGSAWVTLWDSMLNGQVTPVAMLDLMIRALPREYDEQLMARVVGYASHLWWRFLTPSVRQERAAKLEALLSEGLARAKTPSQKATWFGGLRTIAQTPETLAWLRQVWSQQETIPGLPLAETDYTTLALELAVREVSGWNEILTTQLGRIENPDRKSRFDFVLPALSADPGTREKWFVSLEDVNNRRHEPWVLEGLQYLHHPLRAPASQRFVAPSLALLWDIQKTGDIFFPKRWLDATLGGYSSRDVADTVREFLAQVPSEYPTRLKNITLQSADELFRAADVTKQ
ncbi:MAG: M1 family aminopeptidase [Vicinamibacterales bacterium]